MGKNEPVLLSKIIALSMSLLYNLAFYLKIIAANF